MASQSQATYAQNQQRAPAGGGGGGGQNQGVDYLIKTKVGKLKLISLLLSFLAMCFVAAALNWYYTHNYWASAVAGACIILVWIFSVFIVVAALIPDLTRNENFPKIDTYGHLTCTIAAGVGAAVSLLGAVLIFIDCTQCSVTAVLWAEHGLVGYKAIHLIMSGLLAAGHAVVCFLIWSQVKRTVAPGPVARGGPTGAATQSSFHPSQQPIPGGKEHSQHQPSHTSSHA